MTWCTLSHHILRTAETQCSLVAVTQVWCPDGGGGGLAEPESGGKLRAVFCISVQTYKDLGIKHCDWAGSCRLHNHKRLTNIQFRSINIVLLRLWSYITLAIVTWITGDVARDWNQIVHCSCRQCRTVCVSFVRDFLEKKTFLCVFVLSLSNLSFLTGLGWNWSWINVDNLS